MTVTRRRVHYFAGFDPRGARFYHDLYEKECARQARLSGARYTIGPRRRVAKPVNAWTIHAEFSGAAVETDYRFMVWDDIVRARWRHNVALNLAGYASLFLRAVASGAFSRIVATGKGTLLAALAPIGLVVVPVLAALAMMGINWIGGIVALAAAAVAIVQSFKFWRLGWLMNIIRFCCDWGYAPFPELEARMDVFADDVARAGSADDILLVGHSAGVPVAMAVMSRLKARGVKARLLTLGGVLPIMGYMPEAGHLREQWRALAADETLEWLDLSSLSDPLSFARVDPLADMGIARANPKLQQRRLVKIVHMFDRATFMALKRDKLRIHFQYLMAAEKPVDYDYFLLTAGPLAK